MTTALDDFSSHKRTKVSKMQYGIELTLAATGLSGGSSDNSCGAGTAAANEHNAMVIKTKYFHDIICMFADLLAVFFFVW